MKRFGLIGYPLSHSFSKKYFTEKFHAEGLTDCTYDNFPLAGLKELRQLLHDDPSLKGLNVTIPYKEAVLPFLDEKDEVVETIQACNCIKIIEEKLFGYNTDVTGFRNSLTKKLLPHHNRALILGTGGASKAIAYVLQNLGIAFSFITRNKKIPGNNTLTYNEVTDDLLQAHTLIVNTTPLGMFPDIASFPPINYDCLTERHYLYDVVYNPEKTCFLQKGEERGAIIQNGLEMLIVQADESWKIWNSDL